MKTLESLSLETILQASFNYLRNLPALAEEFFQETAAAKTPQEFNQLVLSYVPEEVFQH